MHNTIDLPAPAAVRRLVRLDRPHAPITSEWLHSIADRSSAAFCDFAKDGDEEGEVFVRFHEPVNGECVVDLFAVDPDGPCSIGLTKSWPKTRSEALRLLAALGVEC